MGIEVQISVRMRWFMKDVNDNETIIPGPSCSKAG